jgi:hypothetical protein
MSWPADCLSQSPPKSFAVSGLKGRSIGLMEPICVSEVVQVHNRHSRYLTLVRTNQFGPVTRASVKLSTLKI